MRITDIPTKLFNSILTTLQHEGWQKTYEYDAFDAWIDYGEVILEKDGYRVNFTWSNWEEGEIEGNDTVVLQFKKRFIDISL